MQYTRNVHFEIKPGRIEEFDRLFKTEVLPVLKSGTGVAVAQSPAIR